MKKSAILTFDYEVFLGQNTGTIENCVLNPTRKILQVLKKNKAKAVFFVDATWLLFLKQNLLCDFYLVAEQLRDIVKSESTVELHLHPQWIDAYIVGDKIGFKSFEKYKLHSLSQEDVITLFQKSIELLESITLQKVHCFRAGGFTIEPFSHIKSAFEILGIKYDFSVVPGMLLTGGNVYDYDFSDAPKLPYYRFQNDVKKPDPDGAFVEIPVSTYLHNPLFTVLKIILSQFSKNEIFGDGKGIYINTTPSRNSLKEWLHLSTTLLTLDNTNNIFFKYLIEFHLRCSSLLVIISHPKTFSRHALLNLSYIAKRYTTLNSLDLDNYMFNSL